LIPPTNFRLFWWTTFGSCDIDLRGNAFWGNCDWGRRNINVANRNVNINNFDRSNINNFTKWEHNADHRHGVKYNNADVRQKFAKTDIQAGKAARQDFRGKDGQKVLEPDRGRPGAGDRDRPAAADRDRDRPAAGNRDQPGVGGRDRSSAGDRDRPQAREAGGRQDAGKGGAGKAAPKANPKTGQKASQPSQKASQRPSKPQRDTAFSNIQSGPKTHAQANRGRQSVGGSGGAPRVAAGGGGGAPRIGGAAPRMGGGGRGGGGRRSDVALKHDIILLGRLDNGLGFYRFSYTGSDQVYVGVMAQEVQMIMPEAVTRARDGYLEVFYEKLGLKFQTYEQWIASGAQVPTITRVRH
jgi:Chaperone of endosialidase